MSALSGADASKTLRVLQFTDTHFFKDSGCKLLGVDTSASFAEVYKEAAARYGVPDFYLLTGDLSQDETEESYKRLSEYLKNAGAPCYFLPGNHDKRQEMSRGLLHEESPFCADRRVLSANWQIILLDSLIEGEVGGYLEQAELDFLSSCLDERPDLHALVTLHHHPVEMGARWLDGIGLANAAAFLERLKGYKSVRGVLWGHVHQAFDKELNGLKLMATPSTCVQFKAGTDDFCVDPVPPGFRFIELHSDGRIDSAVIRTKNVARGLELSSAGY